MRFIVTIATTFLVLAIAACSPSGNGEQASTATDPLADSPVVASVNGEGVTQALLDAYLRARNVSDPSAAQQEAALKELINLVLLRQQASKTGLADDPQLQADLALQRLSTVANRQVRTHVNDNPVTDDQARAEYERTRDVTGLQEYHLKHILLEKRQVAEMVIKTLNEGGDFKQLAEKHSIDERNDAGGDLGWINLAQLPDPLPEAVKGLEPGEYSREPVQSRFGWHVLKLVESRELDPPDFDQVKSGIVSNLQRRRMESYVQGLREDADVKVLKQYAGDAPAAQPETGGGN